MSPPTSRIRTGRVKGLSNCTSNSKRACRARFSNWATSLGFLMDENAHDFRWDPQQAAPTFRCVRTTARTRPWVASSRGRLATGIQILRSVVRYYRIAYRERKIQSNSGDQEGCDMLDFPHLRRGFRLMSNGAPRARKRPQRHRLLQKAFRAPRLPPLFCSVSPYSLPQSSSLPCALFA
jgi:hypothetical protein